VRLAQAGFVSIAVEKIDTGYLSRDGASGVDEKELATFRLAWGRVTRTHQLMACLASAEILAGHPRVDETRIGATGVSLGGWLSVQTALCSQRIAAVADFGRKTVAVPTGTAPGAFQGMGDLCHIIPGMASVCDRNLLTLLYCPRPMLAGHGRKDAGSHREAPVSYQRLFQSQYRALGKGNQYRYHIHDGGDTMPDQVVIDYFREVFVTPPTKKDDK
ncbi:MAG: dienelactone hydrolase family protein, partial [Planctomycetaceae bacterium]